jgi:hypothetical protein
MTSPVLGNLLTANSFVILSSRQLALAGVPHPIFFPTRVLDIVLLTLGAIMFVTHPRPKKNALVPPTRKKRKVFAIEEISFDTKDRAEYLTGFHKRKVERRLKAREKAEEKAREEKLALRKEVGLFTSSLFADRY